MTVNRRSFLKGILAASSLAALPGGIALIEHGLDRNVYRMRPGETLEGLYCPKWAKVIVADNCVIDNCSFVRTSLEINDCEGVRIIGCWFHECRAEFTVSTDT